jgi:hypothetical protein
VKLFGAQVLVVVLGGALVAGIVFVVTAKAVLNNVPINKIVYK